MPPNSNFESPLQLEETLPPIQDLIDLIKDFMPENWEDQSRRIEPWQSGYLLIRQTPEVHTQINMIFAAIRESSERSKRLKPCITVLIILDRIDTPDAMAIVKEIWKKHSDPYIVDKAKNLLKHHGKKRPAFFGP
jgi:hypothetical protein